MFPFLFESFVKKASYGHSHEILAELRKLHQALSTVDKADLNQNGAKALLAQANRNCPDACSMPAFYEWRYHYRGTAPSEFHQACCTRCGGLLFYSITCFESQDNSKIIFIILNIISSSIITPVGNKNCQSIPQDTE